MNHTFKSVRLIYVFILCFCFFSSNLLADIDVFEYEDEYDNSILHDQLEFCLQSKNNNFLFWLNALKLLVWGAFCFV